MIPDAVIEEIKYRNNIEDVISSYVTLKRAGSNMNGLCPFHNEKTPSFTVFSATRSFYCFGCGAGGDVITFIMRAENIDYPSALELLAKRAGITIPQDGRGAEVGVKRRRILDMNRDAARYFHDQLKKSPEALAYFQKRALAPAIINRFGLGYAPNDFGLLGSHMRSLGYTDEELITGFLCGKSQKTGRPYDYFRGRVMFPIIDISGDVVAFGGRVLDDSLPKYLNSSDTPAFKKSRNLFALNFAKNRCAEEMILCEGYMDVIALHGAGFENAVATLGTAITPEHARIMKHYTKKVIISYDADDAGQRAADKAFRLLEEVGLETRLLKVQNAKDPDEFIKKFGADRFRRLLEASTSRFEFNYSNIVKKYDITDYEGKIKAADELCEVISGVWSAVERDIYLRTVSGRLEIPYEGLKRDAEGKARRNSRQRKSEETRQVQLSSVGYGDRVNTDYAKNPTAARAEEIILGMLELRPELTAEVQRGTIELAADDFFTDFGRRVFDYILTHTEGGTFSDGALSGSFTPEEVGRVVRMRVARQEITNSREIFCDCVARLKSAGTLSEDKKSVGLEDLQSIISKKRSPDGG
ncbi:MAG: DNA primase [Eubacteriales bacterium]